MCDAAISQLAMGDLTIDALCEGHFTREPAAFFPNGGSSLAGVLELAVRAFLLRGPGFTALVDSGLGTQRARLPGLAGSGEPIAEQLRRLGVAPADIDLVVYTHLHFDHFGNIGSPTQPTFPSAEHYVSRREFTFWQGRPGPHGEAVAELMAPFVAAGQIQFVDRDTELRSGLLVSVADGHTPGHLTVRAVGSTTTVVFIGDLLHHVCQVTSPHLSPRADEAPDLAQQRRREYLHQLASTGWVVAAPHLTPGPYWTVRQTGDTFSAAPVRRP